MLVAPLALGDRVEDRLAERLGLGREPPRPLALAQVGEDRGHVAQAAPAVGVGVQRVDVLVDVARVAVGGQQAVLRRRLETMNSMTGPQIGSQARSASASRVTQ